MNWVVGYIARGHAMKLAGYFYVGDSSFQSIVVVSRKLEPSRESPLDVECVEVVCDTTRGQININLG